MDDSAFHHEHDFQDYERLQRKGIGRNYSDCYNCSYLEKESELI